MACSFLLCSSFTPFLLPPFLFPAFFSPYSFSLCVSVCTEMWVCCWFVCFSSGMCRPDLYVCVWTMFSCSRKFFCAWVLVFAHSCSVCLCVGKCVCVLSGGSKHCAESVFMSLQWIVSMHARESWDYTPLFLCLSYFLTSSLSLSSLTTSLCFEFPLLVPDYWFSG